MPIELQTIHTTTFLRMDTEVASMQERVNQLNLMFKLAQGQHDNSYEVAVVV